MGYFSNGTEGAIFQEQYCIRCVHDRNEDCRIWLLHLLHNGAKESSETQHILDTLMPRSEDGLTNTCAMFHECKRTPTPEEAGQQAMEFGL